MSGSDASGFAWQGAPEPTAPEVELDHAPGHFWSRVLLVVPSVFVVVLGTSALSAYGLDDPLIVFSGLHLAGIVAGLSAGAGLYLRWRMTGEAPVGWLGAAALTMSLTQLPLLLMDYGADPLSSTYRIGPTTRLVLAAGASWLLFRSLRADSADVVGVHPLRTALATSIAACAVATGLNLGQREGVIPAATGATAVTIDLLVTAGAFAFAGAFGRRTSPLGPVVGARVAVALAGLGLSAAIGVLARLLWAPLTAIAAGVALVALLILAVLAHTLLRSVIDLTNLRVVTLSMRAASAEMAVRQEEERLHEVKTTVAGIHRASDTLSRDAAALDARQRRTLEQMLAAELGRLERLLGAPHAARAVGRAHLDEVIRPLVVCEREMGADVHWRPAEIAVVGDGDILAQIVHILLVNCREHAPGARVDILTEASRNVVRVTVRDLGPGISGDLASRIFERGVRSSSSSGQGLGLHIARQLARGQGGDLKMVAPTEQEGARFVLTLQPASAKQLAPPHRTGCPEETG